MSRPKDTRVTYAITVNLPPDLAEELQLAAYDRAIGRSLLVEMLLREGMRNLLPPREFMFGAGAVSTDAE